MKKTKADSELPLLMTVSSVAKQLNLCTRTVQRMCKDGTLSAVNIGSPSGKLPRWRIRRDSVESFAKG